MLGKLSWRSIILPPTPLFSCFSQVRTYRVACSLTIPCQTGDRKTDGGFPETKDLKNRIRNINEPGRDLGHVDRSLKKAAAADVAAGATVQRVLDPSKAMPVKEVSDGGVSGGTSPTLQEDEVMLDAGPTISASAGKCQDRQ